MEMTRIGMLVSGIVALLAPIAGFAAPGDLDPTFSGDGLVTSTAGALNDTAYTLAVQADGKIVAAGGSESGSGSFSLFRYNIDGTLDTTTFGAPAGYVTNGVGGGSPGSAQALVIQPDGKLVTAGWRSSPPEIV